MKPLLASIGFAAFVVCPTLMGCSGDVAVSEACQESCDQLAACFWIDRCAERCAAGGGRSFCADPFEDPCEGVSREPTCDQMWECLQVSSELFYFPKHRMHVDFVQNDSSAGSAADNYCTEEKCDMLECEGSRVSEVVSTDFCEALGVENVWLVVVPTGDFFGEHEGYRYYSEMLPCVFAMENGIDVDSSFLLPSDFVVAVHAQGVIPTDPLRGEPQELGSSYCWVLSERRFEFDGPLFSLDIATVLRVPSPDQVLSDIGTNKPCEEES